MFLAVVVAAVGACGSSGQAARSGPPAIGAVEEGLATYYSSRLAGRRTASGERYDPAAFTAAHRAWPFGTLVRVVRANGRGQQSVIVRVNDRGPFSGGRVIDLSLAAARRLNMLGPGVVRVRLEVVAPRGRSTTY